MPHHWGRGRSREFPAAVWLGCNFVCLQVERQAPAVSIIRRAEIFSEELRRPEKWAETLAALLYVNNYDDINAFLVLANELLKKNVVSS